MRNQHGFTITELMFAMTFVAVLLLILVGATIQLSRTYNKGLTLKRVNQSGRTVGEEMQRAIQHASGVTDRAASVNRLCFGNTSFIWVQPDLPSDHGIRQANKYEDGRDIEGLVKVHGQDLCNCAWSACPVDGDKATQLLDDGLVVRKLELTNTPSAKLVGVRYTISTPGENLIACGGDDDFCALNRFDISVYARGY